MSLPCSIKRNILVDFLPAMMEYAVVFCRSETDPRAADDKGGMIA